MKGRYAVIVSAVILTISIGLFVGLDQPNLDIRNDPIDVPVEYTIPVNETWLEEVYDNIVSGGPPPDGIPPIDTAVFFDVSSSNSFLQDTDIVFGLEFRGHYFAFPQRIMVWHEIVNTEIDGSSLCISYCPLTGSAVAFNRSINGNETSLGTSGKLVNSNLIMYDRATQSYWPQIMSQAISGSYKGLRLERIQLFWTHWSTWRDLHPDTLTLSPDTGFVRNYHSDPYGSYDDDGSYYNDGPFFFPLMNQDSRLEPKTVVIGFDINGTQVAVEKSLMKTSNVVNVWTANFSVVLFQDWALRSPRAYASYLNGTRLTFVYEDGQILDEQFGAAWSVDGTSTLGSLDPLPYMDVMWGAWYAYFPRTGLICSDCREIP
ncbi:MAG: DUF3179 domain-containing protein [Candidatus Thorarchaeota archaeon]|jgi:hypothetical protein